MCVYKCVFVSPSHIDLVRVYACVCVSVSVCVCMYFDRNWCELYEAMLAQNCVCECEHE